MRRLTYLLLFAVCLLGACGKRQEARSLSLTEGQAFPEIALNYSSGSTVTTNSFRGKLLILNVWATWCPPCRREMPDLQRLSQSLDAKRFAVIGISTDEDAVLAEEFLKQNNISFVNFFDQGGKIAKQIGMQVYPETFLISSDGVLLRRMKGFQDWGSAEMIAELEQTYRDTVSNKEMH